MTPAGFWFSCSGSSASQRASCRVTWYSSSLTNRRSKGREGPTEDFTDLHAWCECYIPGAGWVGLDPTSGLFTAEGHIPVACSPQPSSAAPIEGATEKAETEFSFNMEVTRIVDVPRVTKPYSDEQWAHILKVGHEVDARLEAGNVRLTMGGEPTFVSSKEPDAPEWNTAAMGGTKHATGDRSCCAACTTCGSPAG